MDAEPRFLLNGHAPDPAAFALLKEALSTPAIIAEKGGYLFKSRVDGQTFHFGIQPNFLNGQRTYHYDIDIGPSVYNLIGSINANGTLTAAFKLDRAKIGHPLPETDKREYRRQYAELARFLVECGWPASFPLDAVSTEVLRQAELANETADHLGLLAAWRSRPPDAKPKDV
jgi:hypothetical protein